jgi:hypothetical protein
MQKAAFLMSLGLIINSSAAFAAAPVFQLNAHDGAQLSAIDSYPPRLQQDTALQSARTLRTSSGSLSDSNGATFSNAVYKASSNDGLQLIPAGYSGATASARRADVADIVDVADVAGAGTDLSSRSRPAGMTAASRDSLFYFLKNFRARPVQQPAHWTLFLVGLCFVLYQIRRRPMRAAIGFNTAAKLIGGGGRNTGSGGGLSSFGTANAVSA